MTSEQKIAQYLTEAHALEAALVQTLTAHVAMTPRSEYRSLLERHLAETREHAERVRGRLEELRDGRGRFQSAYGAAQTAVGQMLAAGKAPLDLLRGTGGEEKLLKNAKDEAASEALEIATYDALEALAAAAGDPETAAMASELREQEEAFLAELRALIPQLARDVVAAADGDSSYEPRTTGAADAARRVARFGQSAGTVARAAEESAARVQRDARRAASEVRSSTGGSGGLPIEDYDELTAQQVVPKLRLLSPRQLEAVEAHERAGRARKRILQRIEQLRGRVGAPQPAASRR
jgi:ferritin-like metal-binding protein YciE